jgi:hypothetical protein
MKALNACVKCGLKRGEGLLGRAIFVLLNTRKNIRY